MKELAIKFEELVKNYPKWLKEVEETAGLLAFTTADFFSFEPYFAELNHLSDESMQLYREVDQLPEDTDRYHIEIEEGKILFSRLYCGGETYYDSFFIYGDNEKWRCQIYTNGVETKPIFVEKIILGEQKQPLKFQRYDTYAYREQEYKYPENGCEVAIRYLSKTGELHSEEQLTVEYQEGKVTTIKNVTRNQNLFDINQKEETLDDLLVKCHDTLVEKFIAGVEKAKITQPDICALLIEYNLQHVFPPSIGFAQQKEKEAEYNENYPPMSWLNAPDMELFFECEFFYGEEDGLYDEINARLDELEYEGKKKIAFDFYANLCRTLQKSEKFNSYIKTTKDYFVTACDFEECNHNKFLDELLPKKQLEEIEQETADYHQKREDKINNDPEYQMVINKLADAQADWSVYEDKFKKLDCKTGYATDLLFGIEPFFTELKLKRAGFDVIKALSATPEGDDYIQYKYVDNQIVHVAFFRDKQFASQIYYDYCDEVIEVIHYSGDPAIGEVKVNGFQEFHTKEGKVISQLNCRVRSCEQNQFIYDEEGLIVQVKKSRFMYSPRDNMKSDPVEWIKEILYTENKEVKRITSTPVKYPKSTVMYSIDDSYVIEEMEKVTQTTCDYVIENLKKRKDLPQGICFEIDSEFCFPTKTYFKPNKQWKEQTELYREMLGNSYLPDSPFTLYVFHDNYKEDGAYFTKTQCLIYIEQAFQLLCDKVNAAINDIFEKSIEVIYKGKYQSFESLEEVK